jgi:hypothetical protein
MSSLRVTAAAVFVLSGCAAALPYLAAAVPIAERALDWIEQVERHVSPRLEDVDAATAAAVRDALPVARAAARTALDCGRAADGTVGSVDCADALRALERALAILFDAGLPLGVRPGRRLWLLGAAPDGAGELGVPTACSIVQGEQSCAAAPGVAL